VRIAYLIVCLIVMASGAVFGALNPEPVLVDFYLFAFELRLGIGLLLAALCGAALGGFCMWAGVVLPLSRRVARQAREARAREKQMVIATHDELTL